jgi:hypothetical protein
MAKWPTVATPQIADCPLPFDRWTKGIGPREGGAPPPQRLVPAACGAARRELRHDTGHGRQMGGGKIVTPELSQAFCGRRDLNFPTLAEVAEAAREARGTVDPVKSAVTLLRARARDQPERLAPNPDGAVAQPKPPRPQRSVSFAEDLLVSSMVYGSAEEDAEASHRAELARKLALARSDPKQAEVIASTLSSPAVEIDAPAPQERLPADIDRHRARVSRLTAMEAADGGASTPPALSRLDTGVGEWLSSQGAGEAMAGRLRSELGVETLRDLIVAIQDPADWSSFIPHDLQRGDRLWSALKAEVDELLLAPQPEPESESEPEPEPELEPQVDVEQQRIALLQQKLAEVRANPDATEAVAADLSIASRAEEEKSGAAAAAAVIEEAVPDLEEEEEKRRRALLQQRLAEARASKTRAAQIELELEEQPEPEPECSPPPPSPAIAPPTAAAQADAPQTAVAPPATKPQAAPSVERKRKSGGLFACCGAPSESSSSS